MKLNIFAASVFMFLAAGVAGAGQAPNPCRADAAKFCKGIKPGGGRIIACLKAHEADLSAECREKGVAAKGKVNELAQACKGDLDTLCKDAKSGHGEKIRCLKEHEKDLSESCKTEFAKIKEERQKKNPCFSDLEKFCKDVKPGGGRLIACLKEHQADLSAGCKARQAENKEKRKQGKSAAKEQSKDEGKQDPAVK